MAREAHEPRTRDAERLRERVASTTSASGMASLLAEVGETRPDSAHAGSRRQLEQDPTRSQGALIDRSTVISSQLDRHRQRTRASTASPGPQTTTNDRRSPSVGDRSRAADVERRRRQFERTSPEACVSARPGPSAAPPGGPPSAGDRECPSPSHAKRTTELEIVRERSLEIHGRSFRFGLSAGRQVAASADPSRRACVPGPCVHRPRASEPPQSSARAAAAGRSMSRSTTGRGR